MVRAPPIPVLSSNSLAYFAGGLLGGVIAAYASKILAPQIQSCVEKIATSPPLHQMVARAVPLVSIGLVSAAAYYVLPSSQEPTPAHLFLQNLILRVHSAVVNYLIHEERGCPYTLQAQLHFYWGIHKMPGDSLLDQETIKLLSKIVSWGPQRLLDKAYISLADDTVPIVFTDRCCSLFPPFYCFRFFSPCIAWTCNKNIIWYSLASILMQASTISALTFFRNRPMR